MVGQEGSLFRFTLRHSLVLLLLMAILVYLQAYSLTWLVPG
jgi:lactate permease